MLWDLGFDVANQSHNLTAIKEKIDDIDASFDLVMIAEHFEESMVLLRDLLCWHDHDVTHLNLNSRKKKRVHRDDLSRETTRALRSKLAPDLMLYRHFKDKFNRRVREYGVKRMEEGVERLRKLNDKVERICSSERDHGLDLAHQCPFYMVKEMNLIKFMRDGLDWRFGHW